MKSEPIPLLIVDDDPVFSAYIRSLVETLSDELSCAPDCVGSAEKALEIIANKPFELLLLDYNLPGASGLDMLAEIQRLPPAQQPAVVMLTASGNEEIAVEAMKRGAKDYLPKAGLDVAPLTRAITTALAQKRMADQLARYTAELQEKNAQIEAELTLARDIQLALLPQHYPSFPHIVGEDQSALQFSHRYIPATTLAGDFFHVLALSDTQAGMFICDVMGHGVRSALVAAMMRALLVETRAVAADPGRFLTETNRGLVEILDPTGEALFASAFYLVADLTQREMRYANAGHPAPLHLRREAGTVAPLPGARDARGLALGLMADSTYPVTRCPLAVHDALVFFTDGLLEVEGPGGELYGDQRLVAAVRERLHLTLPQLFDELLRDADQFQARLGTGGFADDICLLGMHVVRAAPNVPVAGPAEIEPGRRSP